MNRNRVSLYRFRRDCPRCGGVQDVATRNGATRITGHCAPWCPLNNRLLTAGVRVRFGMDIAEADDRMERRTG